VEFFQRHLFKMKPFATSPCREETTLFSCTILVQHPNMIFGCAHVSTDGQTLDASQASTATIAHSTILRLPAHV
jgi:hypothetical protein